MGFQQANVTDLDRVDRIMMKRELALKRLEQKENLKAEIKKMIEIFCPYCNKEDWNSNTRNFLWRNFKNEIIKHIEICSNNSCSESNVQHKNFL